MKTKKEILERIKKYKIEKLKHNSMYGHNKLNKINLKIKELEWVLESGT